MLVNNGVTANEVEGMERTAASMTDMRVTIANLIICHAIREEDLMPVALRRAISFLSPVINVRSIRTDTRMMTKSMIENIIFLTASRGLAVPVVIAQKSFPAVALRKP